MEDFQRLYSELKVSVMDRVFVLDASPFASIAVLKYKNNWIDAKKQLPKDNESVLCKIEHWHTKGIRYVVLKKVNESDQDWRTTDDNSELSYDWGVLEWKRIQEDELIVTYINPSMSWEDRFFALAHEIGHCFVLEETQQQVFNLRLGRIRSEKIANERAVHLIKLIAKKNLGDEYLKSYNSMKAKYKEFRRNQSGKATQ